jgi:hypothetical protein
VQGTSQPDVLARMCLLKLTRLTETMSRKRRSKTLEKAARAVKDSEEFVEHIFNIARGFAAHHELDAGVGARGVRRSLAVFAKHAAQLNEWLAAANQRGSPEHEALGAIRTVFQLWLRSAVRASKKAGIHLQGKKLRNAPRFAAEALRATFEHHKLKVSHQATTKKQSDAIKLLCAIAKDGGDPSLTPAQAREWLIQSIQPSNQH